ncbi:hypothetical protein [Fusobacterium sp.]|uniref:hypothetical protein n=1 Tax=Fusobacterium sp. TaxID=68766 RepID=UPI00396CA837
MRVLDFFADLFKKNEEEENRLKKIISELEETINRKNHEISDLINEIERINQGTGNINNKQMELIEKNIKETKEENKRLKSFLERYNINFTKERYYYRIELERFFISAKFKEIVDYLLTANIRYIQDITNEIWDNIPKDIKNLDEAKMKLDKFWSREAIEWDIITYMNKGDKVTKIYNKSRKLTNILSDEGIEFMEEMLDYNFYKLVDNSFKKKKIDEFIKTRDKYYEERRVSIK